MTVKGLGWRGFEQFMALRYDNKYAGEISAVTTKGTAIFQIRAAGPVGKHIIQLNNSTAYAPGAYSQKHGHLNSACFYIIKGRGHDVHDGRRIEWKAGDVMFVENGCVHQHFNDDPDNEAILLVFKAKPLFLFMHLLYQKMISYPPNELPKGHEDWMPPTDL